jgi:hypothetical protein
MILCLLATGVAGQFSDVHVQALKECLLGGLAHVEEDGKVRNSLTHV